MLISRRRIIAVAGVALVAPNRALASDRGVRVIVRGEGGILAVDPRTGETDAWNLPPPATPAATPAASIPDVVATPVTEGAAGYWMAAPGDAGFIFRYDTGAASTWWWRAGKGRPVVLDLPGDLEPALPSGTVARWFHGATVEASHLGAGTLRLLAIDLATGETVLDHALDRRLELAATKVSDDGAIVGHVQSATTGVAFWLADLRDTVRHVETVIDEDPGKAAASAVDFEVATDGDAAIVAAGLTWSWPGAPAPAVTILWSAPPDIIRIHTLPGELLGIVQASYP